MKNLENHSSFLHSKFSLLNSHLHSLRCHPHDRRLSPLPHGMTPHTAIDEIQMMQKGDRSIDGIGIAADLEFDIFGGGLIVVICIVCHFRFPLF
jgi:hypothetical protein